MPLPQMHKGYTPVNTAAVLFKPKSPSDSSKSIKREPTEAIFISTAQTGTPTSGRTQLASADGGLCDGDIRNPFYTPWDSRAEGRRPINFTGRTELQARNFKEELKLPGESRLNTFRILTYGTGLSTVSDNDRDENGNLTFSRETIGDITGRLEVRHVHDFTGEGTTSLQKLPQFTVNFSRMRVSALPLLGRLNDRMESVAEKFKTETPILSLFTVPTLESTSFDLDVELGNFFREVYKGKEGDERDVYLQTLGPRIRCP